MREILFRGKSTDNGKWIEGQYIHLHKTTYCVKEDYDAAPDNDIHQIVFEQMTDWGLPNEHLRADIDPLTLGQFTGLTDKNNKMIFEGDIVTQPVRETRKHSPCLVEFKDGKFQAHYISKSYYYDRYYDLNSYTKIIGNIHDNPELLGE